MASDFHALSDSNSHVLSGSIEFPQLSLSSTTNSPCVLTRSHTPSVSLNTANYRSRFTTYPRAHASTLIRPGWFSLNLMRSHWLTCTLTDSYTLFKSHALTSPLKGSLQFSCALSLPPMHAHQNSCDFFSSHALSLTLTCSHCLSCATFNANALNLVPRVRKREDSGNEVVMHSLWISCALSYRV